MIDQAHALVSSTTDLREFIHLLDTVQPRHTAIRLADLPQVYWVAMDLALTRDRDQVQRLDESRDIRAIAEIAESLDPKRP